MNRLKCILLVVLGAVALNVFGAGSGVLEFDKLFADSTLRVDIGVARDTAGDFRLSVDSIALWQGWYGRRVNLDRLHSPDALRIAVIENETGDTIYTDTKYLDHTIFEGAEKTHATLLVPVPLADARLSVSAWGAGPGGWKMWLGADQSIDRRYIDELECAGSAHVPYTTIRRAADPERCINIALVAEGYTPDAMDEFVKQACLLDSALFSEQAFCDNTPLFNVVAVMLPSLANGISRPSKGVTVQSALKAHFDSFNLDRLITIPDSRPLWDALEGIPAAHVFILANTAQYGGSGPFNDYAIASASNEWFPYIIIHEFGHTFVSLGDEYEAGYSIQYTADTEPSEPNITTLHDFSGKWQNLIDRGEASLIEGAGYQSKGVWRGCENCLMRSLPDMHFCPVCNQAICRTIDYYTRQQTKTSK